MKKTNKLITVLIFIFLYIPMAVLIIGSFNTGKSLSHFEGFTLKQYAELFKDQDLLALLGNSLLISTLATAVATAFGTFAAVGIYNLKPKMRKAIMSLTNIPMTNPDIVTGISLSLLFVFLGTGMLGQKQSLNFWTLLIAHVTDATQEEDGLHTRLHNVAELGIHGSLLLCGECVVSLVETPIKSHASDVKVLPSAVVALLKGKEVPTPATHAELKFILCAFVGNVVGYTYCPWTCCHGTAGCG